MKLKIALAAVLLLLVPPVLKWIAVEIYQIDKAVNTEDDPGR